MSSEEVAVRACHKVLMQVDNISLIVGCLQRILDQQLRPRPIHLLNTIIIILVNYIKLNTEDFLIGRQKWRFHVQLLEPPVWRSMFTLAVCGLTWLKDLNNVNKQLLEIQIEGLGSQQTFSIQKDR
jgi:hypothetical protein